jgi:hypothetical protein
MEILRWVERLEVTGLEPLALAHRLGLRATYSHVERLAAAGLVDRIYDRGGSLVAITSAGRREARPESYDRRSARPSLTGGTLSAHARATSWAAARSTLRGLPWVSDREMRSLANWQVPVLWDRRGNHRPDLGVIVKGSRLAVEVELTAKSAARLQTILSGYQMQLATGRFVGLIYVTDNARVRAVVQRALRVVRIDRRQIRFLDFDEMQVETRRLAGPATAAGEITAAGSSPEVGAG